MKKLSVALATTMVLGFASFANAADMPVKAPTYNPPMAVGNWTGFYIGANAGWSWLSKSDAAIGGSSIVLISQPVTVPFSVGLQPDGFLGGFQFGYNYQFAPQWLVGIEADLDFADIKDSGNIGLPPGGIPAVTTSASERIKSLGTLRGRFGFLPNPALLLYGTAGLAIGQVDYSGNIVEFPTAVPTGRVFAASSSPTKAGWTIGGGIEWAFARNWSAKVEYLHYDLGSETITGAQTNPVDPTQFATYSFNTRGSIARAGINVRFGP